MKDSGLDFDFWPKAGFGLALPDQDRPFTTVRQLTQTGPSEGPVWALFYSWLNCTTSATGVQPAQVATMSQMSAVFVSG